MERLGEPVSIVLVSYYPTALMPLSILTWLLGFGGTNTHAILESYEQPTKPQKHTSEDSTISLTPFTFSATSEKSLVASLTSYLSFLKGINSIDLRSLAYTLTSRRSALPVKIALSATTLDGLCDKMKMLFPDLLLHQPVENHIPISPLLSSLAMSATRNLGTG